MRTIKAKLRSRRGASITFALLLFLVCAIISSVVIVAASTVGGRMSGLREMDQRYYGATTAARTLQGIFDGQSVEVTYDPTGAADPTTPDDINGILADASKAIVLNNSELQTKHWDINNGSATDYACTVDARLSGGLLCFDILAKGPKEKNNDGTYKLSILFTPNLKKPETSGTGLAKATVSWKLNSLSKGRATATVSGG